MLGELEKKAFPGGLKREWSATISDGQVCFHIAVNPGKVDGFQLSGTDLFAVMEQYMDFLQDEKAKPKPIDDLVKEKYGADVVAQYNHFDGLYVAELLNGNDCIYIVKGNSSAEVEGKMLEHLNQGTIEYLGKIGTKAEAVGFMMQSVGDSDGMIKMSLTNHLGVKVYVGVKSVHWMKVATLLNNALNKLIKEDAWKSIQYRAYRIHGRLVSCGYSYGIAHAWRGIVTVDGKTNLKTGLCTSFSKMCDQLNDALETQETDHGLPRYTGQMD